jgi:CubicO group peptidase (beta-lactamase class C family)
MEPLSTASGSSDEPCASGREGENRAFRLVASLLAALTVAVFDPISVLAANPVPLRSMQPSNTSTAPLQDQLQQSVDAFLAASGVPAVGAALVIVDQPTVLAVAGHRTSQGEVAVTTADLWHIGSISKSFTSTLIGRLIERPTPLADQAKADNLDWDTPLGRLLPFAQSTAFEQLPLRLFLGHRSGLIANPASAYFAQRDTTTPIREQRSKIVAELLASDPVSTPGTAMLYSNAGYIVAGTALEHLLDASWEELVRREVFVPLGLESAGFGPPGSIDTIDQPRGHVGASNDQLQPVPPTPFADNPTFLGPAGTIHLSLSDLATYARAHLEGELGKDGIVSAATFRALHTPLAGQNYALGWIQFPDGEGPAALVPGDLYMHNGSNTMSYAIVFFAPEARIATIVTVNAGIHNARAVDAFAIELMKKHGGSASTPATDDER